MRCALYLRMSLDKTGEALGIERQREECERLALQRGYEVVAVVEENNRSATTGERPGYRRVVQMLQRGEIDAIIVWKMDRLLRRLVDLEELINICEQTGGQVITASGDIDLTNSAGRLIGRILASVARSEMETKSERHRLANQQRAKAGLPHKGRRAYGYEADGITINESEALVLKDIAHRFLSGHSYNEIAYYLNASGLTTVTGKPFYSVAVRQMLQRKRYAGIREYDGTDYDAQWTPIFDADTFTRIQHTIRQRSEKSGNRPMPRKYLLTGLLFCGECGHPLNGSNARDHRTRELRRVYRCRSQSRTGVDEAGCGKVTRGAVPLEWWLRELICYRLDSGALGSLIKPGDKSTGELLKQRAGYEVRLSELLDDYTDGTLTKTEYRRAKERVQAQLDDVGREIDRLHYDRTLNGLVMAGESVRMRWESETDGWRRQLIELLVERIEVRASRKLPRVEIDGKTVYFNSEAVSVVWRA